MFLCPGYRSRSRFLHPNSVQGCLQRRVSATVPSSPRLTVLSCRLQEYIGIKPTEPLPRRMHLAWHPSTRQIAVAETSSHVHVCNAGVSSPGKGKRQSAVTLQSELLLWHDIQQQVWSAPVALRRAIQEVNKLQQSAACYLSRCRDMASAALLGSQAKVCP